MITPEKTPVSPDTLRLGIPSRLRIRVGLFLTLIGLFLFLLGARPAIFNLDRSPVVGFVQIAVFLVGLAVICVGGYICLTSFWRNGDRTIAADIGSRLVATGYVISVFSGMADVFGMGTAGSTRMPFFGPWQARGVQLGEAVIALGFLLLIPYRRVKVKQPEESAA
jgi:hypothetical protein